MARTFDEAALWERVDGDAEFLAETVEMLSSDGRDLIAQLRQAVAADDAAALGRVAHTLKGMLSNFCADEAEQGALAVELLGKNGDVAAAPGPVGRLEQDVESLINELQQFLSARR